MVARLVEVTLGRLRKGARHVPTPYSGASLHLRPLPGIIGRIATGRTRHLVAIVVAPHVRPRIVHARARAEIIADPTGPAVGVVTTLLHPWITGDLGHTPGVGVVPASGRALG